MADIIKPKDSNLPKPVEQEFEFKEALKDAKIYSIKELDIANKTVLMRLDFNVPLKKTEQGMQVDDDSRIVEALPTIQYALQKGARLVLASHLGRPDGKKNPEFSLEPVALHLAKLLKQDVTLADDCVGDGIEMMIRTLKGGQVMLLENLRFHAEEEANEPEFVKSLGKLCEIYITDAFGTAHRKHASTYGVPESAKIKGMGLLIEKELKYLDQLLHSPPKPFWAILGGSKVTDKIKTIDALMKRVDGILIGGAMAHAFWAVKGIKIPEGAKQPKSGDVDAAREILKDAENRKVPIVIPSDTNLGFDIGSKTVSDFISKLKEAKAVFWNGPLGWFEKPEYSAGTFEVAKALADFSCVKIVGGGDTVSAIKQSGVAIKFDHLSTGGGAVLEYLEQGSLPGVDILKLYPKQLRGI